MRSYPQVDVFFVEHRSRQLQTSAASRPEAPGPWDDAARKRLLRVIQRVAKEMADEL